jgi:hypothetical protein
MVAPDDTLRTCLVALTLRSCIRPAVESLREANLIGSMYCDTYQIYGSAVANIWTHTTPRRVAKSSFAREPGPADATHMQWPASEPHVNNLYIRLYKQPNIFVHKNCCIHI